MKKFIYMFIFAFVLFMGANAQTYKVEGNNFVQVSNRSSKTSVPPEKTDLTWTDTKGNVYPIYITTNGSCFIIKTSKNTGKEYRNYLKPDVCKEINKKLNRTYKTKNDGR